MMRLMFGKTFLRTTFLTVQSRKSLEMQPFVTFFNVENLNGKIKREAGNFILSKCWEP